MMVVRPPTLKQLRLEINDVDPNEWPKKETQEKDEEDEQFAPQDGGSESGTEYSSDSIDGTSPALIAEVSKLLIRQDISTGSNRSRLYNLARL